MRRKLVEAQRSVLWRVFPDAHAFCTEALRGYPMVELLERIHLPGALADEPASAVADLSLAELKAFWETHLVAGGITGTEAQLRSAALAERSQLVRAFDDPEGVLEWATQKAAEICRSLPQSERSIEVGRNPGDVLDPYILAATQSLLYGGSFQKAIEATVSHKALMILEGLMGHLHEEVVGRMRGNAKNLEPRGGEQELYDPVTNPFPGIDVVQPPLRAGDNLKLHQVKSKTGSLNASGGARLAAQMQAARERYGNDIGMFAHALVGNTLRGHRSMGTMRRKEPALVLTVGENAFRILTGSGNGGELLLRVYQRAFRSAAVLEGYGIEEKGAGIARVFLGRSEAAGEGFFENELRRVTDGPQEDQDSRYWVGGRRPRQP